MNPMQNVANRLRKFQDDITLHLRAIVIDNQAFIIDANAENQLYELGETREGTDIASYRPYSEYTIDYKIEKGQPYDRVTLRDEGDFESSFYVRMTEDGFEIAAGDWKTEELRKKYGDEIFGLNEKNLATLIWDMIYPELLNILKKTIYA